MATNNTNTITAAQARAAKAPRITRVNAMEVIVDSYEHSAGCDLAVLAKARDMLAKMRATSAKTASDGAKVPSKTREDNARRMAGLVEKMRGMGAVSAAWVVNELGLTSTQKAVSILNTGIEDGIIEKVKASGKTFYATPEDAAAFREGEQD